MNKNRHVLVKIPTGIDGFDEVAQGGLPQGRATVVSGTAGSGKTIFGMEFLYRGATRYGEPGVFVTFEEPRRELIRETDGFGWRLVELERQGKMAFVDASGIAQQQVEIGEYDFGALIARIRYAIEKIGAKRVVIDSVAALFLRYRDQAIVRRELYRIVDTLRNLGVTSVITAERVREEDAFSRFGVEDFVVDSVVFLYNSQVGRDRERQIEVVKLRGAGHKTGRHAMIIGKDGMVVFPDGSYAFAPESPTTRVSTGVAGVDGMTAGGLYRGSTTLLLGPSGTGRTVLGLHFLVEGFRRRERGLLISFEEGPAQLYTDADSFGWDFRRAERQGLLRVLAWQPEALPLEVYLQRLKETVEEYRPRRVVIDSLTPLVRTTGEQRFRRFFIALNVFLKAKLCTSLVTYTTGQKIAETVAAESDMAMVADNIIAMRLVDNDKETFRELMVVKSRASAHGEGIQRYTITGRGIGVLGSSGGCQRASPKKHPRVRRS